MYNDLTTCSEMQKRLIPVANKLVDDMMKKLEPKSGANTTEFELTKLLSQYTLDTVSRVSMYAKKTNNMARILWIGARSQKLFFCNFF